MRSLRIGEGRAFDLSKATRIRVRIPAFLTLQGILASVPRGPHQGRGLFLLTSLAEAVSCPR